MWDTKNILPSFRPDRARRLVFGSMLRHGGAAAYKAWARRALVRLFPQLAAIEFEHEWYGQIGMTDDAVPRLHSFGPESIGVEESVEALTIRTTNLHCRSRASVRSRSGHLRSMFDHHCTASSA